MKYPIILFFRYQKYSQIDLFFEENKDKLLCTINFTSDVKNLNKLFDSNNHLLITFGDSTEEYFSDVNSIIADRIRNRWLHYNNIQDVNIFNSSVNYCYMHNIVQKQESTRPIFSLFTTCYNSYEKILRAYNSLVTQILKDWEWVIVDDSPDVNHFTFLKETFINDKRIRLYKRSENSGSIGNVKNEAVSLCRGKYVLELDHDDEILSYVLSDSANVFNTNPEIGFIYMEYSNIYENGENFNYGNSFGLGYSGYYREKYNDKWLYVAVSPNINNVTLSHIVSVPNHPRIWRRSTLMEIGNYSEYLPISDDYELLLRTAVNTKMAKIPKLGYIQYMNNNNNNFSLIRNSEINRLRYHLTHHCYNSYKMDEFMKNNDSYEEEININNPVSVNVVPIWKKPNFQYKYCNYLININRKTQYCIIGLETLYKFYYEIKQLYKNSEIDFLLLDNKFNSLDNTLCNILDNLSFEKMKCYSMEDCSDDELVNYFHLIYKSCDDYYIIKRDYNGNIINTENIGIDHTLNNIERKKMTIITPCIRPQNLHKIKESINFDYINEWIIVYDGNKILDNPHLFIYDHTNKIKEYIYKSNGASGNQQRNYALDNIINTNTYVYFLDDDNIIHPELYNLLDNIENNKIYSFDQKRPTDVFPFTDYLKGDKIQIFNIDTSMFLIDYNLCKNIRWDLYKYNADGIFIMECYSANRDKWVYIDKLMSYYNYITN